MGYPLQTHQGRTENGEVPHTIRVSSPRMKKSPKVRKSSLDALPYKLCEAKNVLIRTPSTPTIAGATKRLTQKLPISYESNTLDKPPTCRRTHDQVQDTIIPKTTVRPDATKKKQHSIDETVNHLNHINLNWIGHQEPLCMKGSLCVTLCREDISRGFSAKKRRCPVFVKGPKGYAPGVKWLDA